MIFPRHSHHGKQSQSTNRASNSRRRRAALKCQVRLEELERLQLLSSLAGGSVEHERALIEGKPRAHAVETARIDAKHHTKTKTAKPQDGTVLQKYFGVAYSPTWPNWSSGKPAGDFSSPSGTTGTITITAAGDPGWVPDVFGSQTAPTFSESVLLCQETNGVPNYGVNQIDNIVGNTSNTLTIDLGGNTLPSNFNYYVILTDQLTGSDFATAAFQGLWGQVNGQGRNDLGAMQTTGYNLVRLFNWDPSLGTPTPDNPNAPAPSDFQAHTSFLDTAYADGMQVMVPVSNYFLSNAQYGWQYVQGDTIPQGKLVGEITDPSTSFAYDDPNVPDHIRADLQQFIKSIETPSGSINPAVQSISIGNEIDLGLSVNGSAATQPTATEKLLRADWWIINLRQQLNAIPGGSNVKLTIPLSNADQGETTNDGHKQTTWFSAIIDGVTDGEKVPHGTVNGGSTGGTFSMTVPGLASNASLNYTSWYFNSLNSYQIGQSLKDQLKQYDTGQATGTDWSHKWPDEKFAVPLMLTELGYARTNPRASDHAPEGDIAKTNVDQMKVAVDYLNAHPDANILGVVFYKFNDEPNYNNLTQTKPYADAVFGTTKYYEKYNDLDAFRNASDTHYYMQTGWTPSANSQYAYYNYSYPVYTLYPVKTGPNGEDLSTALGGEIAKAANKWTKPS